MISGDLSYIQCMYVKGHRVPVPGEMTEGLAPPPSLPAPAAPTR